MKAKLLLLVTLSTLLAAQPRSAGEPPWARGPNGKPVALIHEYKPKDYSHLLGMEGFSNEALQLHFKLYQGYVKNTNLMLSLMEQLANNGKLGSPEWAGLKRRFGWEWDGMRLHEFYFDNLGGDGSIDSKSALNKELLERWGSYEDWKKDFVATGAMRGIGWAVLYRDPETGTLMNTWINEHDRGHLAGADPLLIMDVFEHAYLLDYGLDRGAYIDAFFKNIDWGVVEKRYEEVAKSSPSPTPSS